MKPNRLATVAILVALAIPARAEPEADPVPFAALYSTLTAERDVAVRRAVPYGTLPRQKLDVYQPADGDRGGPIVLFIYGGSWESGDRAVYGFVGAALAARGITTVIPDYRLYPEVRFPAFVDDAAHAYAWVARNIGSPCGGTRPIVIAGHSAGAHITGLLALDRHYIADAGEGSRPPAGWIGLAGPYAFDPTTWDSTAKVFMTAARNPDRARPVTFARRNAPPALLLHGKADDVVKAEASQAMFDALKAAGASAQKIEYPGVGHVGLVLSYSAPFRWRADTLDATVGFVRDIASTNGAIGCRAPAG